MHIYQCEKGKKKKKGKGREKKMNACEHIYPIENYIYSLICRQS